MVFLAGVRLAALGQTMTVLHSFTNTPDGYNPLRVAAAGGVLYGSTAYGGISGIGTLFSFNTNASSFSPIYNFYDPATNGSSPDNVVVSGGVIYGATEFGGTNGTSYGSIYSVATNGSGFSQLYSFSNPPDGEYPQGGLLLSAGTLYGTTHVGGTGSGSSAGGTLFKINTNGAGYAVLHSFTNTPDGAQPQCDLVLAGGLLYGTTASGGVSTKGTIFSINTNGGGYSVLYSFTNQPDAMGPNGGLALSGAMLYGTGSSGGSNNTGAIFEINTNGTGYKVLYNFSSFGGNLDGTIPKATLTAAGNCLYGTTVSGGSGNAGTVFIISTNGSGFATLASFTNTVTGSDPLGGVIRYGNALWGCAGQGGPGNYGTFFKIPLPALLAEPLSLTVTNYVPAVFSVTAADDSPVQYQWYYNTNTLLAGQTNSSLNFSSVAPTNAGVYTVVASDYSGSVTSSPALLTALLPPMITQQPQGLTVTNGNAAAFTNAAIGTGTLDYQWYLNTNTPVNGATGPVLTFSPATTNNQGYYTVVVTNLYGAATSSPAQLTVIVPVIKPAITQQPQNFTVTNGYDAAFTNAASGTAPLFFQWYFNTNTPVAGGTNAVLIVNFAATNNAGYYTVVVTNSAGSVTSTPALLTVISTRPIIFTQPQSQMVTNGGTASFAVVASGKPPLNYQWYTNQVTFRDLLVGKTNSMLTISPVTTSSAGNYLVLITNSLGSVTSSPALLTVVTKPVITQQPQSVVVTNGNPATFTADAFGPGLLKFQWFFQTNTAVSAATNTSLSFTNVYTTLRGYYSLRVTNTYGAVTSSYALLSVSNGLNSLSYNFDPASGSPSFALANAVNSTNRLWAATNLTPPVAWFVVASNVMAANGLWFYTDTNSARTNNLRFYRFSTP